MTALLGLAAENGNAQLYDAYVTTYHAAVDPEARDRFLYALGDFSDPALRRRTVDPALSPEIRNQDAGNLLAHVLAQPSAGTDVWPRVQERWSDLSAKVDPFFGIVRVIGALGTLCDEHDITSLQTFFATHHATGADRTLQQSYDEIRSCAATAAVQKPSLAQLLRQ